MQCIIKLVSEAMFHTGENVAIRIRRNELYGFPSTPESELYQADLINADDGRELYMQSNGEVPLLASGADPEKALEALDRLCDKDFKDLDNLETDESVVAAIMGVSHGG